MYSNRISSIVNKGKQSIYLYDTSTGKWVILSEVPPSEAYWNPANLTIANDKADVACIGTRPV